MQNKQELIERLYQLWVNKQASPQEVDELFNLLAQVDTDNLLGMLMKKRWEKGAETRQYSEDRQLEAVRKILDRYPSSEPKEKQSTGIIHSLRTSGLKYAAAILLIFLTGAYFWKTEKPKAVETKVAVQPEKIIVIPGGNKAILTLADGSKLILDSANNGRLIQQGGATIVKSANGEVVYAPDKSTLSQPAVFNTMTTPKGGIYKLTLPDGSMAWLNAASSITFPTLFTGNERNVSITGEVYFEVAKNEHMPFRVNIRDNLVVEVLGTHFNINAYSDELNVNATLLEGSVRIRNDKGTNILLPGQQAQVAPEGNTVLKKDIDLQAVIAWKNDEFQFGEKADFRSIMRQIARWYNIEVEYEGNITGHLGGSISRKADISLVLQILEKAGAVKFDMVGRKIIVKQ